MKVMLIPDADTLLLGYRPKTLLSMMSGVGKIWVSLPKESVENVLVDLRRVYDGHPISEEWWAFDYKSIEIEMKKTSQFEEGV
jgi:hypothetical protein